MSRIVLAAEHLAGRLDEAAKEVGLDHPATEIHRALDIRHATVSGWFTGDSKPSYENAIRLADYFQQRGVSPLWLLMDQGPMMEVDVTEPAVRDALRQIEEGMRELRSLGKGEEGSGGRAG